MPNRKKPARARSRRKQPAERKSEPKKPARKKSEGKNTVRGKPVPKRRRNKSNPAPEPVFRVELPFGPFSRQCPEPLKPIALRIDKHVVQSRKIRGRFLKAWSRYGAKGDFDVLLPLRDSELIPDEQHVVLGVIHDAICDANWLFMFDRLPARVRKWCSVEWIQHVYRPRFENLSDSDIRRLVEYANEVLELTKADEKITLEYIGYEPRQRDEQALADAIMAINARHVQPKVSESTDKPVGAQPRKRGRPKTIDANRDEKIYNEWSKGGYSTYMEGFRELQKRFTDLTSDKELGLIVNRESKRRKPST